MEDAGAAEGYQEAAIGEVLNASAMLSGIIAVNNS